MKKYIYKINQYLLENFPTIWNTKIVWMLLVSFILHILFFIMGYFTLTNPEMLQVSGAKDIFFKSGVVFFNIIISILLIVIWLIYLFKNNAFKNFYPTSKLKLFTQFFSFLLISFCAITFYFSYGLGLKTYIKNTYKDATIANEIVIANKTAVFFSKSIKKYTLDNLSFPKPFFDLYCETKPELIDNSKPYLSWLDSDYQFYTLTKKERKQTGYLDDSYNGYVYSTYKDSISIYYYKDSVYDILKYKKSAIPTYYNYSDTFYHSINNKEEITDRNYYNLDYEYNDHSQRRSVASGKYVYELLNRNDSKEIKKLLNNFITILNIYKIKHNVTTESWFQLIYHPNTFEVKSLLRDRKKDFNNSIGVVSELLLQEKFSKDHTTSFFIETDKLSNVFNNIERIKSDNIFKGTIYIYMWLSFFIAILIFAFRVTNLKLVLFAIITSGVLVMLVALITAIFAFIFEINGKFIKYFSSYLSLCIGAIILSIPMFFIKKVNKTIVGICLNISIIGFVLFIFLIVSTISLHQKDYCIALYNYNYKDYNCFVLLDELNIYISNILFIISIVFIYFYNGIIKKWKALPEK